METVFTNVAGAGVRSPGSIPVDGSLSWHLALHGNWRSRIVCQSSRARISRQLVNPVVSFSLSGILTNRLYDRRRRDVASAIRQSHGVSFFPPDAAGDEGKGWPAGFAIRPRRRGRVAVTRDS